MSNELVSNVPPTIIRTVGEMLDHLVELGTNEGNILWYRGHRRAGWDVEPTINRAYDRLEERNFCHRFRSRAAIRTTTTPSFDELAHWLSLMRHYGLPTRLLDWSRSPMVGLYFAMEHLLKDPDAAPEDAVLWVLSPHHLNRIENVADVSDLTPSIVSETCLPTIKGAFWNEPESDKVLAAMAHDVDLRIFIQQGCFTIHSSRVALNRREDHSEFLRPLLIPAECARTIARQVFAAGMRRGDIYPDLTNLAAELVETHDMFKPAGRVT